MFRNYVKTSLDLNEFNKKIKDAPEGQRYCNAFCQKYMNNDEFYDGKANCKECYNQLIKARKMIDNNQLTAEQFKEDPTLVPREKTVIPVYRTCITCEEELTLDKFEATRKECIQCRKNKKKINYEDQFKKYKEGIEEVKTDITALSNLLKAMSVDLLKLVVRDYKITISHSDRKKDIMLVKIIDHFKSLLNPYVCLGNCGSMMANQFSVCDVCKLKPKNSAEEIMFEFEKNLDELIEDLDSMKPEDSFKYNKKQIILIAKKLDVKFYQTMDKPIIMKIIDDHLQKKKDDEQKSILKNLGGEINLNGIIVLSRPEDGFINATAMCKAGGKEFNHWNSLESTKELVKALEDSQKLNVKNSLEIIEDIKDEIETHDDFLNPGIPAFKNIQTTKGKYGGSWIHPDLAVPLAQWISPKFSIKVSGWIRELALCGTVSLGKEKTDYQLLELQTKLKKSEDKYRKLLQKKQYYKFKEGPVFYIISDVDGKSVKFKPGFEGVDIDVRLQQHRSTTPGIKLEYLVYSNAQFLHFFLFE